MYKIYLIIVCSLSYSCVSAQELDPRAYANLPKNLNAAVFAYGLAKGNVIGDPAAPISGFKITTNNFAAGYMRTFDFAKKLSRLAVTIPFVNMAGKLTLNGRDTSGVRTGFGDARIKLGINLIGSPALDKKDFRKFQQGTVLGISLITSVPIGLYYPDKRINIGSNRWAFKPELGISRRFKHLYAEAYMGVWFYTTNKKFLEIKELKQQPVYSAQTHLIYYFKNQVWVGADGNWFSGGETSVNNTATGNLQNNWRVGATVSAPLSPKQSIRLQFHVGAFTNTGYDYNLVSIAYQYIFF